MNHQQVIKILLDIERYIDVNAFWMDGVQVWPILRRDIWMYLLSLDHISNVVRPIGKVKLRNIEVRNGFVKISKSKEKLKFINSLKHKLSKTLTPADILFWSRKEEHTEEFADGVVDRIIDPLIWDARENGLVGLKLSRNDGVNWDNIKQFEQSVMISLDQLQENRVINKSPGSAENLLDLVKEIIPFLPITYAHIVSAVRRVNSRADIFDIVLDIVKPRLVMLGVFYAADAMALIHACRCRRLPVVDVQHGKQGLYHGMYAEWSVMPAKGYSVLPDIFWTWGDESRDLIHASLPSKSIRPHAVVGGNRWLAKWREDNFALTCSPSVKELFAKMANSRCNILVSLQPLLEPLPDLLLEAMKQAPKDWFWLIKTHPHQCKNIVELDARIKRTGVESYEIEMTSASPLYSLLRRSDVHVTCWSSVAYEALSLNKPTVLIDPTGLKFYSNYIARGLFSYADTAAMLLNFLTVLPGKMIPAEVPPYIETSDDQARKALKLCFRKRLNWLRLWQNMPSGLTCQDVT